MSLFTLLIVTIVLIITLVVLLLRTPRGHAGRHAAWVVAGALLWIVSINLYAFRGPICLIPASFHSHFPAWISNALLACNFFFGCTLLWFSLQYPQRAGRRRRQFTLIAALLGLWWMYASFTSALVAQHQLLRLLLHGHGVIPPFACWLLLCCLVVIVHLGVCDARLRGITRLQARYTLGVCCLLAIGVSSALFLHPAHSLLPDELMPLLTFGCGLPILAYAFGRFTLVDGKVFMRPLLAFTFTVIMLYFFQRCLFGPLLVPLMTITDFLPAKMRFILVMAMALAFQPLYLGFAYGINRFLFKFPYDDRRVVDEISSALVSVHEAGTLFARLTGILLRTLRPESCAGYLLKDRLFRRHNPTEAVDALPESLGEEELLIAALRRQPRVLVAEDLLLRAADAEVILGHAMLTQGIAVAMPLLVDEQLRGCLLLSEKKSGDAYLRADVRVLQVMSRYGGLALENVRYYAELQRLNTNLEECVTQRTADLDRAIVLLKEADKAKDSFLAVVSHELRNPMTTISGFAEMGLMGAESAASKRAFAKILHGVQLQTRMVMDLIDISRIVHGKLILEPQPTDLWALTVATMEQLEQRFLTKEITLIMHPPTPAELPVLADPARLEQVLSNLVGNAIKFGVEHGTVTITGGADARGCWLTVQDNGKGISAKDLPHIFTLFHQKIGDEQLGGLGVGLGLVQGIMALHYGSVIAASPGAGQGATFTIALPHADAAAQAYTSASQPTVEREKGCV